MSPGWAPNSRRLLLDSPEMAACPLFLGRINPQKWRPHHRHEHSTAVGVPNRSLRVLSAFPMRGGRSGGQWLALYSGCTGRTCHMHPLHKALTQKHTWTIRFRCASMAPTQNVRVLCVPVASGGHRSRQVARFMGNVGFWLEIALAQGPLQ